MKSISKKITLCCCLLVVTNNYGTATPQLPTQQAAPTFTFLQMINSFFSVFPDPTQPGNDLLPSLNQAVQRAYHDGLGLPDVLIANVKRFYSYLQQGAIDTALADLEVKINQAQTDLSHATTGDPQIPTLQQNLSTLQQQFATQRAALDSSIVSLCTKTDAWQQHLKMFIADSFEYELALLSSVHEQEKMIFSYLPTFETAYYSDGYAQLRNGSELVRMFLVLTDAMRQRAVAQCSDWSTIADQDALYTAIETFKESDFYSFAKRFDLVSTSTARYPFPAGASVYNTDGSIASGFSRYLTLGENKQLQPTATGAIALAVDETNQISFTALGNMLFTYRPASSTSGIGLDYKPDFYKLFQETPAGFAPKPLYMELMGFSGIKLLNGGVQYLFNTANLEDTMQKLVALGDDFLENFPSIIPYAPSDYLYLDDINQLMPLVNPKNADASSPQSAASFFHHMIHAISHAFNTAIHAIKDATWTIIHKTEDFFVSGYHAVVHFSEGLYYTGMAFFTGSKDALSKAGKAFNAVGSNLNQMGNDIVSIINATAQIAKSTMSVIGTVVGQTIGAVLANPNLGDDLSGLIDTIANTFIDVTADITNLYVQMGSVYIRLSYEAISILGSSVAGVLSGGFGGQGFANVKEMGNFFVKDMLESLLTTATFYVTQFTDGFKNFMQGVGYLVSTIADVAADLAGAVGALNALAHGGSGADAFYKWQDKVNEHRRLITGVVTTAIMVGMSLAAIPFSGGMSLSVGIGATMAIMGAGMMAMSVVGNAQEDTNAIHEKAQQEAFLDKYKVYVPDNQKVSGIFQNLALTELTAKMASTEQNYERGLVYFQNYLNSTFNSLTSTAAFGLGNFYKQLTTVDPTVGTSPADPGYLYGIKTDRIALNPGQGFTVYNKQRNTFAQEVAEAPTQIVTGSDNTTFTLNPSPTQFWLNQKDLSTIPNNQPLSAEVRWRSIYETEGAFYIGLFMSERSLDLDTLHALYKNYEDARLLSGADASIYVDQAWENLDTFNRNILNFDHLARCFVLFRQNGSTSPALGLYQHEGPGNGWLDQNVAPVSYQTGVWYRMKISVSPTQTQVKCWQEGDVEPDWQKQIATTPAEPFAPIAPLNLPTSKDTTTAANTPQLTSATTTQHTADGTWTLAVQTNKGVVTSQGSDWALTAPTTTTGTAGQAGWSLNATSQNNTQAPNQPAGSLGFIASGAAVEYEIISPASVIEITPARKANDTKVEKTFTDNGIVPIEKDREKAWVQKLAQQLSPTFGNFTLAPLADDKISQGIFIYTTQSTNLPAGGADYVVFASSAVTATPTTPGTAQGLGMSPTDNPSLLVSLVTGNAYTADGNVQTKCVGVLAAFESVHPIDSATEKLITDASTAYFKSLTGPFIFANASLEGLPQAFQNGGAAYSSKPLDTLIATGSDYYVLAELDSNNRWKQYGLTTADQAVNGLISLVSGNVYGFFANTTQVTSIQGQTISTLTIKQLTQDSFYASLYSSYQSRLGATLFTTIQNQNNAYQIALIKANQQKPAPAPAPNTPPVSTPTDTDSGSIYSQLLNGDGGDNNFNDLIDGGGDFGYLGGP